MLGGSEDADMTAPTPGLVKTLTRAAAIIEAEATTIHPGELHAEYRGVAKRLRRAAKYFGSNPLGGPAKVFDAMADRIRAGDDYYEVLKDHGFRVDKPKGKK